MTGTAHSYTAANAAKHPRLAPTSAVKPSVDCISLMSTPALNPLPSAASTTARTSGSAPAPRTTSASSNHPSTVSALTGGTSTTTSATCSETVLVMPIGRRPPTPLATSSNASSDPAVTIYG